jgi:hypothetical protein
MRLTPIMYATLGCGLLCIPAGRYDLVAQAVASPAANGTCAGLLADNPGVSAIGPSNGATTSASRPDSATNRTRTDSASFGIGGARTGAADIILWVGVHADEVRFAKQPNVRVRLCWGGDTLRVVQRDNIPSPVVAGTTYRNVFVAVELIGRINAECLADRIGVGAGAQRAGAAPAPVSNCAFLGGSAGARAQTSRPPVP